MTAELVHDTCRPHLAHLPDMLRAERARRGLNQLDAATQMGISQPCLARTETRRALPNAYSLLSMLAWLGVGPDWFTGTTGATAENAYRRGWNDRTAALAAMLHTPPDT